MLKSGRADHGDQIVSLTLIFAFDGTLSLAAIVRSKLY